MDINGAVISSSVYVDDECVAKDVEITLPELVLQTVDVQAMGTLSLPMIGRLDNLQMSIKKVGVDINTAKMHKLEKQTIEVRWVQQVLNSEGTVENKGCKAFIRTLPQTAIPSIGVANGSASELEGTYNVTRMQLFVNGEEVFLVDRIAGILQINGKNYYDEISSLL